jgi:hypothetical protein
VADVLFIRKYIYSNLSSSWRLLAFMWIFQDSFWSRWKPMYSASGLMAIGALLMFT